MATTIAPGVLGTAQTRVEGREKVTGEALYAYEHPIEGTAYAWIVQATIARGEVRVVGAGGERTIPLPGLHRLAGDEPQRDTVLEPGELITAVDLAPLPAGSRSTYRKVRDRASFAFAVVSIAAAVEVADGALRDCRIALGGVAHAPWRAARAEEALRGGPATTERFAAAADAELEQARPLRDNAFKVPLARNTLVRTLADLAGA